MVAVLDFPTCPCGDELTQGVLFLKSLIFVRATGNLVGVIGVFDHYFCENTTELLAKVPPYFPFRFSCNTCTVVRATLSTLITAVTGE